MKSDKQTDLINILKDSTKRISCESLSKLLNVSERTVRSYIKEINDNGSFVIDSNRDGYQIVSSGKLQDKNMSDAEDRIYHVLSDLLTAKDGFNVFDEADSLSVSSSTIINTVIPQIKKMISEYSLTVESTKYQYVLNGSEQNKRKLIGHLVASSNYGFFTSSDTLEQLFPGFDVHGVMQKLYDTCQNSRLFLNNFALNNLLIHVLIILIRLESDDDLSGNDNNEASKQLIAEFKDSNEIIALADQISSGFAESYNIHIPETDYQQILMLIALSVDHGETNLESVLSQEFIDNVIMILNDVSKRYNTPSFSHEFALQFALHMYQAVQRSTFRLSYPNPIGPQIKKDYAPVYDMAVYFAHRFAGIYHIELSEDEIAFIAFHIGAYQENNRQNSERISCILVVESYHNFARQLIQDIESNFQDSILIVDVISMSRYLQNTPQCDLLLTTIPLSNPQSNQILINPILTRQNISTVRNKIEELTAEKEQNNARDFLHHLLHKELYFRNVALSTKTDYINFMGRKCIENGYVQPEFIQDVLLRESVSSTAFTDALAVPHAISQYADRSFICVVHDDKAINWGTKEIHFILMIGIAEQDMKYFKSAFDLIVDLFYSAERTQEIIKTDTFEEFSEKLK
jgi:transcriptional antiterminator/mannitol/fructose-specific phosphotransferase system IIA component (Ntr-type)